MSEGRLIDRARTLLRDLRALLARRAEAEGATKHHYETSEAAARHEFADAMAAAERRFERDRAGAEAARERASRQITEECDGARSNTEEAYESERLAITEKVQRNEQEARKQWDEAVWLAETVYEAAEDQPQERYQQTEIIVEARREELTTILQSARTYIGKCRQPIPAAAEAPEVARADFSPGMLDHSCDRAREHLLAVTQLRSAKLFRGFALPFLILVAVTAVTAAALWRYDWQPNGSVILWGASSLIVLVALSMLLYLIARRRIARLYRPLSDAVQLGRRCCDHQLEIAAHQRDREDADLLEQREQDVAAQREKYEPILAEIAQRRDHHLQRIDAKYPRLLEELKQRREAGLAEAQRKYDEQVSEIREQFESAKQHAQERLDGAMHEREERYRRDWSALESQWKEGMLRCREALESIKADEAELFPSWDDAVWEHWRPPDVFAPSIRCGSLSVDLTQMPGGLPEDERLQVEFPARFELPAALDLPDQCSLFLATEGEGRERSVRTLQTVMMRLLTGLPPGKVRLTIIDPVGLGQSFAGFMHLADYEEQFVTSRIWTDARHIEQRLADLTEHMENVIQKYLRNEFQTIAQYNEQAGEIAEPYRFLVIADFPVNFSETSAQRLMSVIASGARCGVHTLISFDRRQPLPTGIDLADLQSHSIVLEENEEGFVCADEDFRDLPLALEKPPSEEFVTGKLHLIGEAAKDATRVEVPFAVISPSEKEIWTADCSESLAVPLGRSGATKLQQLRIGSGTAQHALIAGKTGSGKSTMLHVLITNLALWYSPEQVEFYLIDFKKGVEFKTYALHDLPHARAVAVESDREFGLSVLQRVDHELKRRGDHFRELGVQDISGYRKLGRGEPMPRTLLIIDEFQEMFVEDDKIGQDAALVLDRLVRQGRAFGIHVILGSQTLGGAYTLARSTIGQMQVRIALQCSEADSYLILSDDNAAARLLSRPGEAIYNDAGGAIHGNSPFQICWLPEREREKNLKRVEAAAKEQRHRRAEPLIVFEGNAPADVRGNHLLAQALERPGWIDNGTPPEAWLGDAIAIKGPTAASFRRLSGSNLLVVGQRDESALAMASTALLSLAAQCAPGLDGARFVVLDGTPADTPGAGYLERVAAMLPQHLRIAGWRDVPEAISEVAAELAARREADRTDAPPVFLLVHALQRFRMLRMAEDFGFSIDSEGKPPSTDRLFGEILRDGPPFGIHSIIWCDTATNLNRTLDRQSMREFEMRVLFQMSGVDSTQLIDSPAASRIGLRRAFFYSEEHGVLEKFRPYALPENDWLKKVAERLSAKAATVERASS